MILSGKLQVGPSDLCWSSAAWNLEDPVIVLWPVRHMLSPLRRGFCDGEQSGHTARLGVRVSDSLSSGASSLVDKGVIQRAIIV